VSETGLAWATELGPIDTAPLFRPLLRELGEVLAALAPTDWDRGTLAPAWKVRDVAAHLLDGDLRKIAVYRDSHFLTPDSPITSDRDLARFVNGLNQGGVAFAARLSPRLLKDLLAITGAWVAELVEALPKDGPSIFAVSWAGEAESKNWMDIGREYTERWHHQMQIRDATGKPRLLSPPWMEPLMDLSVRALSVAYASVEASEGTTIALEVHGETSGAWSVVREAGRFRVVRGRPESPTALVRLGADDAWRLLYNAIPEAELERRVEVQGRRDLAQPLLRARSVIV
jgi:uncharacterized protein (TIGR03083 family)